MRRILPVLLAAVLWAEGTLGTVYASEPAALEASPVRAEEKPETGDANTPDGGDETPENGNTETPDNGEKEPETGGVELPDGGEKKPETGSTETTDDGEETPETGDTGAPAEDAGQQEETLPSGEETVSENTTEDEENDPLADWDGEDALGAPPLPADAAGDAQIASYSSAVTAAGRSVARQTPGKADIIARYKAYPWSLDVANSYSESPSAKEPYKAGHLTDKSLENALNLLNFIRYVAGIPADVALNEEYIQLTQAGALVNCVNGELSHNPARPSGFTEEYDELYARGKTGCGSSNIAMGYGNIAKALLNAWMYDGDSSNSATMGHRRWALNPSMTQTGFGAVGAYSAMYAFDMGGAKVSDFVAWPAQNMPIELMNGTGTPWTLSLGSDYGVADIQKVTVSLRDLSKNKSWTFSGASANGLFKVNLEGYGMPNCIIFRPNSVSYDKASRFQVTVTGLTDSAGNDTSVTYNVNFFSLSDTLKPVQEVVLNKNSLHLLKGQEETLYATVKPDNAEDTTLVWNSSNPQAATVDQKGKVTTVGVGETEITVTASNGEQANCSVKVSDYSLYAEGLVSDGETKRLSFDLTADAAAKRLVVRDGDNPASDKITWISENEDVASVGTDGTVTPHAVGETMIWADVDDGLVVLACEVAVEDSELPQMEMREDAFTLTIKKDAAGNTEKETRQLRVYFTPADSKWLSQGQNYVKWKTDKASVAAFVTDKPDGSQSEESETISGNTVTLTAAGAGEAKISAVIVNGEGEPVKDSGGNESKAACTVTVQEEAEVLADDVPRPVALTNTQTTLQDVTLPAGWNWKEPDTALNPFTGGKTKKFAVLYRPEGAGDNILPADRLLEVRFLTVDGLSMEPVSVEGQENAVLINGQNTEIYVNQSAGETLKQLDAEENYKNNECYKNQRDAILSEIRKNTTWSSSNANVISVEPAAGSDKLTAENVGRAKLTAKGAGSTTVKASLKLGKKTYSASVKLTVKEAGGTLTVKSVEGFTRAAGAGAGQEESYTGRLSDFRTEGANQANSKITLALSGATKVTAKSGNAKVVAVKSSAAEGDGFGVSLIVKSAGTARITLTGNDAAKTARTIRLTVGDPAPGISAESVTVNLLQTGGTAVTLYPAQNPAGGSYGITSAVMASDTASTQFELSKGQTGDAWHMTIRAKSGTRTGTYKVKILASAAGTAYELPLAVKVVSRKPSYKIKQAQKLNLFYRNTESLLQIDTGETVKDVKLTGCGDYTIVRRTENNSTCYYVKALNATLKSVKKGKLQVTLEGWTEPFTTSFTVGVEKKAPKFTLDTGRVVFYPKAGVSAARIGIRTPANVRWEGVELEKLTGATGNYVLKDRQGSAFTLEGSNLNQAESVKARITLRNNTDWTEPLTCSLTIKVSMGRPAIVTEKRTLQLNANAAYIGYDAASTAVKWKDGGMLTTEQGVRVSVYCDPKDAKAKNLVRGAQVVFSVQNAQVSVRLNNKAVESGSYKYIVQASKGGQIWKTPLTLKVVNTAPDKAVKLTAKGSIDVLNRDGSAVTLTPSLKALGGEFVIPESGEVKLKGRDAHLFEAVWNADQKTIALRAKNNETLVTKYQYTVTPLLTLRNVNGDEEEIAAPAVKFQVKQGSVKVGVTPKTALLYSGSGNTVQVELDAALKNAPAPKIGKVVLGTCTDLFEIEDYSYDGTVKRGIVKLRAKSAGRAVKGKSYSLQLRVFLTDQGDNVKPVTVRCTVKVK